MTYAASGGLVAALHAPEPDELERARVIEEAVSWIGTPWRHGARVKGAGVDCGQFLIAVFSSVGLIPEIDPGDYPADFALHRSEEWYLRLVEEHMAPIMGPPQVGDVVLYRWGRCLSHGAIVAGWPMVIHSFRGLNSRGVCIDDAQSNRRLARGQAGFWSYWSKERR